MIGMASLNAFIPSQMFMLFGRGFRFLDTMATKAKREDRKTKQFTRRAS